MQEAIGRVAASGVGDRSLGMNIVRGQKGASRAVALILHKERLGDLLP